MLFNGSASVEIAKDKLIDAEEPIFENIDRLEPSGVDYAGFIEDLNRPKPGINLQEIIEEERQKKFLGAKRIFKMSKSTEELDGEEKVI